jgi:hypothetical protein
VDYPTDAECLARLWPTVGKFSESEIRIGWIRNSLELAELALTENVRAEIETDPAIEIMEGPVDWPLVNGDLPQFLPHEPFDRVLAKAG